MEVSTKTKFLFVSFLVLSFSLIFTVGAYAKTGSWENQKTHRPRLLYEPKELNPKINKEIILKRIIGPEAREPYISLYRSVKEKGGRPFVKSNNAGERKINAAIAKSAAFVYAMEGIQTYGDKALQGLVEMNKSISYTDYSDYIWNAEELMQFCQAYDLLLGSNYPFFNNSYYKTIAKNRIKDLAINLYKGAQIWLNDYIPYTYNNYRLKTAAALGMAAITLNDEEAYYYFTWEHPREWMAYCMHTLDKVLAIVQTTDKEGGYAEGPGYLKFSATNYLPFMWAYQLFTDGENKTIDGKVYKSPLKDQRFKNIHDWWIKIRMPDGRAPAINDCFMDVYFYSGMLAGIYQEIYGDAGEYAWDWTQAAVPYYTGDLAVDLICAYDDKVTPHEPTYKPTQFLPEAGDAVLRSSWGKDATYMCLLGEHGDMRSRGFAHNHPDGTSFIIYAKGELLAMDPGYISWDQHEKVNQAKNHNLILVDGNGPEAAYWKYGIIPKFGGVDAYIENYFDMGCPDYSEVRTGYFTADIKRAVVFPEGRYFAIVDDVQSYYGVHNYDWLLHGNGGGSSGGTCSEAENGAVWSIGKAKLKAYITTTDGRATVTTDKLDYHAGGYNKPLTHTVLKANRYGSNTKFLAVLYPAAIPEGFPAMRDFYEKGTAGIEITNSELNTRDLIIAKGNAESKIEVSAGTSGAKDIVTDAQHLFISVKTDSKEIRYFFAKSATYLQYDGKNCFKTTKPVDIAIEINNAKKEINGYISEQDNLVQLNTGNTPSNVENVTSWNCIDGVTTLNFTGKTYFSIKFTTDVVFPQKRAAEVTPDALTLTRVTPTLFSAQFNGEYYGYGMQLEWTPTNHPKAKYYHIQSRTDETNWEDITAWRSLNYPWFNHHGSSKFGKYIYCLPSGKQYYYRVRVIAEGGYTSDWSNVLSATVPKY